MFYLEFLRVPEFSCKFFIKYSHIELGPPVLLFLPKRFSRQVKLETRIEKNGYSRRLEERERGIYVQKFRAYRIFRDFLFSSQTTRHAGHQRHETTARSPSVCVADTDKDLKLVYVSVKA